VTDGGDISFIREMLSISKKSRQSTASASLLRSQRIPDKCSCSAEIAPLKNALSILQADILLIKQRQAAAENLKAADIQSVNQSVKDLKNEIASVNQTMHNNTENIKVQFSNADFALQQRVTQCNSTVAVNSKQIFELQQSVTKALNQMKSNLDETLVNMTSKINDLLPCTNTPQIPAGKTADAATQYDIRDTQLSQETVKENVRSYASVIEGNSPYSLIDLASSPESPGSEYTAERLPQQLLLTEPAENESNEDSLYFGNSKIPSVVTYGRERVPSSRNQTRRTINFAIIRREVAEASDDRRRHDQRPSYEQSHDDPENDGDDFYQYVRKRTKRYFVSGFKPSITEAKISQYVTQRGLKVTKVAVNRKTRNYAVNVIVQVNVEDDGNADAMVNDSYFWPRGVTCKPWLSTYELRQRWSNRQNRYQQNYRDQNYGYE